MNAMIKSLVNKVPSIRLAPWTMKLGEKGRLLSELPEDVDIVKNMHTTIADLFHQAKMFTVDYISYLTEINPQKAKFRKSSWVLKNLEYSL